LYRIPVTAVMGNVNKIPAKTSGWYKNKQGAHKLFLFLLTNAYASYMNLFLELVSFFQAQKVSLKNIPTIT
jgi:hypothetical protein